MRLEDGGRLVAATLLVVSWAGCPDDDKDPVVPDSPAGADAGPDLGPGLDAGPDAAGPGPDEVFAFGLDPAQALSAAPFPCDLYLDPASGRAAVQIDPALSFDPTRLFHTSLSFGTSFTTALLAARDDFAGAVTSVGAGMMLSVTLPMTPANGQLASGVLDAALTLQSEPMELQAVAWADPGLAMVQWLSQRGDPLGYAPFVLRYRETDYALPVLASGNSWDLTLHAGAQLSFANAYGLPAYHDGDAWILDPTVPGAGTVLADEADGPVSDNVSYGGRTHTAGIYYYGQSCHAELVTSLCGLHYAPQYPPIVAISPPVVSDSPICQLHGQIKAFHDALLAGGPAVIAPPTGSCAEVYP